MGNLKARSRSVWVVLGVCGQLGPVLRAKGAVRDDLDESAGCEVKPWTRHEAV